MGGDRGSDKLLAAWKARAISEESVNEITEALKNSPVVVRSAAFHGDGPAGLTLSLQYDGDDVPWCGNDITFWLNWHRKYGGVVNPPRIIINGIPVPEWLRLELNFGRDPQVPVRGPEQLGQPG